MGIVERHLFDIVDLDQLEEQVGVGAAQFELAHMVDIKKTGSVPDGVVFGDGAGGILDGQFVAGEFDHAAAEGHVGIVERCTLHASLLCESGCGHRAHEEKKSRAVRGPAVLVYRWDGGNRKPVGRG